MSKQVISNLVYVQFDIPIVHRWNPEYVGKNPPASHSYLVHPHRHVSKWKVCFKQTASRDIEFLEALDYCNNAASTGMFFHCEKIVLDQTNERGYDVCFEASCEDFAVAFTKALKSINESLYDALHSVEVSEDGENGAILTFA